MKRAWGGGRDVEWGGGEVSMTLKKKSCFPLTCQWPVDNEILSDN